MLNEAFDCDYLSCTWHCGPTCFAHLQFSWQVYLVMGVHLSLVLFNLSQIMPGYQILSLLWHLIVQLLSSVPLLVEKRDHVLFSTLKMKTISSYLDLLTYHLTVALNYCNWRVITDTTSKSPLLCPTWLLYWGLIPSLRVVVSVS